MTYAFILFAMSVLAPQRDHTELARAVSTVVEDSEPLFRDDEDKLRTSALLVAVAYREGSLGLRVEGDRRGGKPTSWCTMQVNLSPGARTREGWSGEELRDDPAKCVTVGMRLLRESFRACPSSPIAIYAAGPSGCRSAKARRISSDRLWLARSLAGEQ